MHHEMSISFHDVAVSFTEAQWMCLENWQKDLYQNAMREIHRALIKLGYAIANPETLFKVKIKKSDETYVRINYDSAGREGAMAEDLPDLLFRIKDEPDSPYSDEKKDFLDKQSFDSQVTAHPHPVIQSAFSIKKEEETHTETNLAPQTKPPGAQCVNSVIIKTEEDVYSIDSYNSAGLGNSGSHTAGLVVIKQEPPDPDYLHQKDAESLPNIIPVVVKQEDGDSIHGAHFEEREPSEYSETRDRRRKHGGTRQEAVENKIIAPKRSKCSSEANEDDHLNIGTKATVRAQFIYHREVMNRSFREQPCFMYDPTATFQEEEEEDAVEGGHPRAGNVAWCKCEHCCVLPTKDETVCCREIPSLSRHLSDDCVCITSHPFFHELCLDRDRLDLLYRFSGGRTMRKEAFLDYVHKLRKTSYRAFMAWVHGYLDPPKTRPIPACVVNIVRASLPYPEELNKGFMKIYDYAAADMALD